MRELFGGYADVSAIINVWAGRFRVIRWQKKKFEDTKGVIGSNKW